jgi:hypothetical protein
MDQQVAIGLGPQQGLEDAVNLGIDGMAHSGNNKKLPWWRSVRRYSGTPIPTTGTPAGKTAWPRGAAGVKVSTCLSLFMYIQ